jgi:hypothetical protein
VVNIIGKKWSTSPEQVVKMDRNIQLLIGGIFYGQGIDFHARIKSGFKIGVGLRCNPVLEVPFLADAGYLPCFPFGSRGSIVGCNLSGFCVHIRVLANRVPYGPRELLLPWPSFPKDRSGVSLPALSVICGVRTSG